MSLPHPRAYGSFDKASRYLITDEGIGEGNHCRLCDRRLRYPSRAWPYSVYKHCFTRRHETRLAEAIARGRVPQLSIAAILAGGQDAGPTTACWDCGVIVAAGDVYISKGHEGKALCPPCYERAEGAGRARLAAEQSGA